MIEKSLAANSEALFYVLYNFVLSRYLRAIKLLPLNSAGAKKLGGRLTARKRPIGEG